MSDRATTRLVEYVPYSHRNERVAIGLLVTLPDGQVRAHLARSLRKVSAVDPSCHIEALREGVGRLAAELSREPELLPLHLSGVGPVRLAPSEGFISFDSKDSYDRAVQWALDVAAEPVNPKTTRERMPISRLFLDMKQVFGAHGWLAKPGEGLGDHRIVPRYFLSVEEGLSLDFALQNGALHCLQTADFRHATHVAQRRTEVQAKALTLGLADQLSGAPQTQRIFVIAGVHEPEARRSIRVAERVADHVFAHESPQDMQTLLDLLAQAMGQPPLPVLSTG